MTEIPEHLVRRAEEARDDATKKTSEDVGSAAVGSTDSIEESSPPVDSSSSIYDSASDKVKEPKDSVLDDVDEGQIRAEDTINEAKSSGPTAEEHRRAREMEREARERERQESEQRERDEANLIYRHIIGLGVLGTDDDWLKVLGLGPGANHREIKSAYRKIAMLLHPDRNLTPDHEAFKMVSVAWDYFNALDRARRGVGAYPRTPRANTADRSPDVSQDGPGNTVGGRPRASSGPEDSGNGNFGRNSGSQENWRFNRRGSAYRTSRSGGRAGGARSASSPPRSLSPEEILATVKASGVQPGDRKLISKAEARAKRKPLYPKRRWGR